MHWHIVGMGKASPIHSISDFLKHVASQTLHDNKVFVFQCQSWLFQSCLSHFLHNRMIHHSTNLDEIAKDFVIPLSNAAWADLGCLCFVGEDKDTDGSLTMLSTLGMSHWHNAFIRIIVQDAVVRPSHNIDRNNMWQTSIVCSTKMLFFLGVQNPYKLYATARRLTSSSLMFASTTVLWSHLQSKLLVPSVQQCMAQDLHCVIHFIVENSCKQDATGMEFFQYLDVPTSEWLCQNPDILSRVPSLGHLRTGSCP